MESIEFNDYRQIWFVKSSRSKKHSVNGTYRWKIAKIYVLNVNVFNTVLVRFYNSDESEYCTNVQFCQKSSMRLFHLVIFNALIVSLPKTFDITPNWFDDIELTLDSEMIWIISRAKRVWQIKKSTKTDDWIWNHVFLQRGFSTNYKSSSYLSWALLRYHLSSEVKCYLSPHTTTSYYMSHNTIYPLMVHGVNN